MYYLVNTAMFCLELLISNTLCLVDLFCADKQQKLNKTT